MLIENEELLNYIGNNENIKKMVENFLFEHWVEVMEEEIKPFELSQDFQLNSLKIDMECKEREIKELVNYCKEYEELIGNYEVMVDDLMKSKTILIKNVNLLKLENSLLKRYIEKGEKK